MLEYAMFEKGRMFMVLYAVTRGLGVSLFFFVFLVENLSSKSRIFHSYRDVTITGERLQILTYARHSWPLSSEGSLACHTYCDTGRSFIRGIAPS